MSLVTHFKGDIKSGKTLSGIYWIKRLSRAADIDAAHIYTNMTSLRMPRTGRPWATSLQLDDLLVDIQVTDVADARYKYGILFLDEAHVYWAGQLMNSTRGLALTALIAQAGKRGLIVVFTSHLAGMIAPKVIELTQRSMICQTWNEGITVRWTVESPRRMREAYALGLPPPPRVTKRLTHGAAQRGWYDANEIIDPFSSHRALGGSKTGQKLLKELEARRQRMEEEDLKLRGKVEAVVHGETSFKGIERSEQQAVERIADQTRAEIMKATTPRDRIFGTRR